MIEDYEQFEGIKGVIRSYKSMKDIRVQCRKLKKPVRIYNIGFDS
jgi:hypothetical protein